MQRVKILHGTVKLGSIMMLSNSLIVTQMLSYAFVIIGNYVLSGYFADRYWPEIIKKDYISFLGLNSYRDAHYI